MDILEPRKRINDISEIYDGKELLTKEIVNLDLSNIDLSIIPIEQWYKCTFYNTSFKNTGIKFIPNMLAVTPPEESKKFELFSYLPLFICMCYCDFSDNDLSYLKPQDFYTWRDHEVCTYGCNFSNTGVNFLKTLRNVILDESYADYDTGHEYWAYQPGLVNWPDFVDIETIKKNPFLKVPSFRLMNAINSRLFKKVLDEDFIRQKKLDLNGGLILAKLTEEDISVVEELVKECEELLMYDQQGYGIKLYSKLKLFMTIDQKFNFFRFNLMNLDIKNVDFEDIPVELFRYYGLFNNSFENVIVNNSLGELLKIWDGHIIDRLRGHKNQYKDFYTPQIKYSSWQENPLAKKRVSDSALTFYTKIYLELDRVCNAKCSFCRNSSFDKCKYDLGNIKSTLGIVHNYVNAVVIGGGEPTLKLDHVVDLRESLKDTNMEWHMFSNGTKLDLIEDDYIMDNFKLNISRHAINDMVNADIFGVPSNKIMASSDIEKLNLRNKEVTLNATCFKGGLDSFDKIIDYINYAKQIGCKKVLIQNLQKFMSLGNKAIDKNNICIDENIFPKVREYLIANGYRQKYPIYATGGYVSYIFTDKDDFSIALQKYITKDELDKEWPKAMKRAFDLSIAPDGNLYENWSQTSGLVKMKKK